MAKLISLCALILLPMTPCRGADLYVLSIGVEPTWTFKGERDLYAGDAVFVSEAFVHSKGLYAHTHRRVVAGKRATREKVLAGLAWLRRSVSEEDVAVIFFSTHGGGDSESGHEVFLYGSGGEYSSLKSTNLWAALDAVKGRTVVLMDTCTSGGMIPPASQLGKRTAFFAGCTATEETDGQFQRADRPHGWFVIALCEALGGKADDDGNGVVTLGEVEKYLPGRAKQFRQAQNAFLVGSKEIRKLQLVRVDSTHPAIELFTAKKKEPGRNPFGETDVSDQDGVPCLDAANLIRFGLAGDGKLLDNLGTSTGSRAVQLYNGRAQINLRLTGTDAVASVSADGIRTAFLNVTNPK